MRTVSESALWTLDFHLQQLEAHLESDVVAVYGPIDYGLEHLLANALERLRTVDEPRDDLAVVLQTPGGFVTVVERMVDIIRHLYPGRVEFIIPDSAMSAGTVFAMSGDAIWMDYRSVLGPIDPQVKMANGGRFVPAIGYLLQYEDLKEKDRKGELTTVDFQLLSKLDLAELERFKQEQELSITLLTGWLTKYKFADWRLTEGRNKKVTARMKTQRARQVAKKLNDVRKWHTHARPLGMKTLRDELKLRVDDFGADEKKSHLIRGYFEYLSDYMRTTYTPGTSYVHSRRT